MQIIFPKSKGLGNQGFVLFIVLGILSVVGILFLTLHSRSLQQNRDAHRMFYAESAKTAAEGIVELFVLGFRESVEGPQDPRILQSAINSNRLNTDAGYFGFFLRDFALIPIAGKGEIPPDQNVEWLKKQGQTVKAMDLFLTQIGGDSYQLKLDYSCQPRIDRDAEFVDALLNQCILTFGVAVKFKGVEQGSSRTKILVTYPLSQAILSRFTLFHDDSNLGKYDRLYTDINGVPIIRDGNMKYQYNFPMYLYHSPLKDPDIKTDLQIYGPAPDSMEALDSLRDSSKIKMSKDAIEERGWLYLGDSSSSVLKMTPGMAAAGQQYLLLNRNYFTTRAKVTGDNQIRLPNYVRMDPPPRFTEPISFTYYWDDPEIPPVSDQDGEVWVEELYEGFYESTGPANPAFYIPQYSAESSLLKVFGSVDYPSRTYTSGDAYLEFAKLSSLRIDRDQSDSDENSRERCLPSPRHKFESSAVIRNLTEFEFINKNPPFYQPLPLQWTNMNYIQDCEEPLHLVAQPDFAWELLTPRYSDYESIMSQTMRIHLNNLIDYPHYTHKVFPPHIHENFTDYSFKPKLKQLPGDGSEEEIWEHKLSKSLTLSRTYLKGIPEYNFISAFSNARASFWYDTQESLEKAGVLKRGGGIYYLNTQGRTIGLWGDLNLDVPVVITGDSSLVVAGLCFLSPVEARGHYAGFECEEIYLTSGNVQPGIPTDYEAQLTSKNSIRKTNPEQIVNIIGSLAVSSLDMSMFLASTTVTYNPKLNPLRQDSWKVYRMALDDHNLRVKRD